MIKPEKRGKQWRQSKTVRLNADAMEILAKLAKQYSTSEGQIVEQMLLNYGPRILEK